MNHQPSAGPARSRPLVRAVLFAAVAAVLVSCGDGGAGGSGRSDGAGRAVPASRTPTTATTSPSPTTPSPSPALTLPVPSDGTDTELCRDGRCEVRVTEGDTIPVPARSGVGRLTVTSVGGHTVMLTAPLIQSQFDSDGGCQMSVTGPSDEDSGSTDLTCEAGTKGRVNKLSLQLLGVVGRAAVLRIGLAASGTGA
ncbi:hypothetical protein [Streptomyces sp. NPDC088910]|uniref:hypothetical protein n=1 Tax=Streptomyces sp. NPDC088910 TaxID=3365911 RepID=UPI0037F471B5